MVNIVWLTVFLASVFAAETAKILIAIPFTGKSHYLSQKDLGLELAKRGHEVYVITAFKEKEHPPTYHQVMVENVTVWDIIGGGEEINVFSMLDLTFEGFQQMLYFAGLTLTENALNSTEVKEFMSQEHKFDVVISEQFFQEALSLFSHIYKAPLILVSTFGNSFRTNYFMRNPPQLSSVIHEYAILSEPNSFIGRLLNLYYCTYDLLWVKFDYLPRMEAIARKYFKATNDPWPRLEDLISNASLFLMNSHYSTDVSAAYQPNMIEVGGLNIKETEAKLPDDLQKILDEAKHGVVYLNFGSNVKTNDLPKEKRDAFMKVFSGLKQTVLMKWEDTQLPGKPDNVIIRSWLPQKDILAHPNIKLFICHGGLIGLQEALVKGVPILGLPVFGDQYNNVLDTAKEGYGEIIEYHKINEHYLGEKLHKMLKDEKYILKAREMSARFKDRPMSGLDTAMWWIEYVIRHKGAHFMKSPRLNMNFFQYNMLDVYFFLISLLGFIVYFIFKIVRIITKVFSNNVKHSTKLKKK